MVRIFGILKHIIHCVQAPHFSGLDRLGDLAIPAQTPEEEATQLQQRKHERDKELARQRELDTVRHPDPLRPKQSVPAPRTSRSVSWLAGTSCMEGNNESLFDLSEDETNVTRCVVELSKCESFYCFGHAVDFR